MSKPTDLTADEIHANYHAGAIQTSAEILAAAIEKDKASGDYAPYRPNASEGKQQARDNQPHGVPRLGSSDDPEVLLPEFLLKPMGLVGDVAEHIHAGMPRKQPVFAVASALATVSTATVNNYMVEGQNTPLGLYMSLVGLTFCGKDHPMNEPGEILLQVGVGGHAYTTPASGPALLKTLSRMEQDEECHGPTMLISMDEFGKVLQKAAMGDGHSFGSMVELMSLFGKGGKTVASKAYSQEKDCTPPIHGPFINVIGATTPETLISALSSEAVVDGFLNRFMLVPATIETPPMEVTGSHTELPKRTIFNLSGLKVSNISSVGSKITIKRGDGVIQMCQEFSNYADKRSSEGVTGRLWGRAYQNAVAVAGILAVGDCDQQHPVITKDHFEWAEAWVMWCVEASITLVKDHVADSKEEAERKKVLMLIKNTHKYTDGKMAADHKDDLEKGYAPRAWLLKKSKHSSKALDEHIETLKDSGLIWYEERGREYGGKVKIVYYAKA